MNLSSLLCASTVGRCLALSSALLTAGFGVSSAWAERADRDKPMNAQADSLSHDDVKQVSIFTGNVVVTKGTIVMRGERVEVRQDAEGFQNAVVQGKPGQLAFFRQKREGSNEFIEGTAATVEYDGKNDRVKFINQASIVRLQGSVQNDKITGQVIVYDNLTDRYTVDGGASNTVAGTSGRVRATLIPTNKSGKPAAAGEGAVVNLKPAATLDKPN